MMSSRLGSLVPALALVVAACGGATPAATTSTDGGSVPTTESAAEAPKAPEAILLSYDLEPGLSLRYEAVLNQNIVMTSQGDPSVMDAETTPGQADLNIAATAIFTYTVADGPEPGTYAVRITGEFSDVEVSGTVDGEPVDPTDIPEFAALDPVETTIIVDEKGNVIPGDEGAAGLFGGDLDGVGGVGGLPIPGAETGSFFGPPLPDGEVAVGDTWSETFENPLPFGGDPITTTIEGQVTGTDVVDGAEVLVIETTTSVSKVEFDLGEFFVGFFEAFLPEDATEEQRAEMDALSEAIKFVFTIDPTTGTSTSWFDPVTGIAHRSEVVTSIHLVMDVAMPDQMSGELVEFAMDMTLNQEIGLRYLGPAGA